MKALKIIVITLVVLGGLIYFAIWYGFRTTSEDISHLKPFSEVIDKELTTKQTCYIAKKYKHLVKGNTYIVTMKLDEISGRATQLQEVPQGSVLKVKEAKRYTNGVTGFKSTFLLGSVFLEELQEEVSFEYAWGTKNYGTDLSGDYFMYRLAPWQDIRLDTMYNYDEDITTPLENYNDIR